MEHIARKREHDSLESMNHPLISGPFITSTDAGLMAKLPVTWAKEWNRVMQKGKRA